MCHDFIAKCVGTIGQNSRINQSLAIATEIYRSFCEAFEVRGLPPDLLKVSNKV